MNDSGAITSKDISIIVQGPVFKDGITARCLKSLRANLPDAEIILSTWQGSDTTGLEFDRLVENQDPSPIWLLDPFLKRTQINNIIRQMISTVAGLNAATRPYALKFR